MMAPPEVSVTVPVMPPSVCCGNEPGARRSVKQQRQDANRKKQNLPVVLLIRQCLQTFCVPAWPQSSYGGRPNNALRMISDSPLGPCRRTKCCEEIIPIGRAPQLKLSFSTIRFFIPQCK